MEPFITTFTGRKINPLNLQPEDVDIYDIAHHLALLNRFVGATKRPVSIAQHSIYVSRLLYHTPWEREGLFHDAPEAYLGDVSKWVKQAPSMLEYRKAEHRAWISICKALDLNPKGTPELIKSIKEADALMVRFETLRMVHKNHHLFELETYPRPTTREIRLIGPWAVWSWQSSETGFLDHARLLGYKV